MSSFTNSFFQVAVLIVIKGAGLTIERFWVKPSYEGWSKSYYR